MSWTITQYICHIKGRFTLYLKEDEQAMVDALRSRRALHTLRSAGGNGGGEGSEG